ncbi:MAG: hypothetical protein IK064_07045, partial [Clostridia bacterium]|nr:hypothetical protein [Clostridia bacterium]
LKIRGRVLSRIFAEGQSKVSVTAAPAVIELMRRYLPEECRRYGLQESDFVFKASDRADPESFDIHYLNS